MADPDRKPTFYERRWFQGAAALVALVAGVWALTSKVLDTASSLSAEEAAALVNTEVVLDASAAMAEPFGDGTKLDAAVKAIETYVMPLENDALALRRAGGSCVEVKEQLVDFEKGNGDELVEKTAEQEPGGRSNMVSTVRAAISDFNEAQFHGPAATRRILIFMGGEDECAEDAANEIRDDLAGAGIDAVFRVVALKVSSEEMKGLEGFKQALAPYAQVEIRPADTDEQLEEVMEEESEEAAEARVVAEEAQELRSLDLPASESEPEPEEGAETEPEPGIEPEVEPEVETEEPPEEEAPPAESSASPETAAPVAPG